MSKNFFEKHPKVILLFVNLIFLGLVILIMNLNIFQDAPDTEKYNLIDKISYQVRCNGDRNIKLRENRPYLDEFRIPPYDLQQKYSFRTDENGFIKPAKIHDNPDYNIFFVGGSTTECETVEELKRFPYLTGRILEELTNKKINSYNAGRSGNSSIHSLNNFINKIVPLNPDIVVRMENINDLSTLLYEASYWNKNKTRSNLSCFSKKASFLRNSNNEWDKSPFVHMISDKNHQEKIKNEQRKILKLFIASVRATGAIPVLATQANRIENDSNFSTGHGDKEFNQTYRKIYEEFNQLTRDVAKDEKVMLIDLAKEVPGSEKYLYDTVHFNNEGSVLTAEVIAKQLKPLLKKH